MFKARFRHVSRVYRIVRPFLETTLPHHIFYDIYIYIYIFVVCTNKIFVVCMTTGVQTKTNNHVVVVNKIFLLTCFICFFMI